ncbi:hypothetical protein WN51_12788 [Melipona quadrifasciata]|uniref:Uncharacterized protein n=1 Tax=Melipona quadrifasciata TaxID=166423 RepID=A0A0M9A4C4_9HYME|nr:hypothetical protein WN51_12788 [Melipona quadrifasciata]
MATSTELQKLNKTITNHFKILTKQINKIDERNLNYEDMLKKITKRMDSHEQVLENLTKVMRRLEIATEKRNTELKNLAHELKTYAYFKRIHTDWHLK